MGVAVVYEVDVRIDHIHNVRRDANLFIRPLKCCDLNTKLIHVVEMCN